MVGFTDPHPFPPFLTHSYSILKLLGPARMANKTSCLRYGYKFTELQPAEQERDRRLSDHQKQQLQQQVGKWQS